MAGQQFSGYMLGEHVGRIVAPGDFVQGEISLPNAVLHPEICRRKVSDLAQTPSPGYADSRSGVGHDSESQRNTEVNGDGL